MSYITINVLIVLLNLERLFLQKTKVWTYLPKLLVKPLEYETKY